MPRLILCYAKCQDRQAYTNSIAASDQGMHCLPHIQQFLDIQQVVNKGENLVIENSEKDNRFLRKGLVQIVELLLLLFLLF